MKLLLLCQGVGIPRLTVGCHSIQTKKIKNKNSNKLTIKNVPLLADEEKEVSGQMVWFSSLIDGLLHMQDCQKHGTFGGV